MAKSKSPDENRQLILDVARTLFLEKGYDQTSLTDIISQLGGLTKGVVYHHFPSKGAILDALIGDADENLLSKEWPGNCAIEKIQYALITSLSDVEKLSFLQASQITLKSPSILAQQYELSYTLLIPKFQEVVRQGVTIPTDFPEEIAELLVVYFNLIIGLRITELSPDDFLRKILFLKKLFESMNAPIISDKILALASDLSTKIGGQINETTH
ncbi:TetR/AcrR family transcriptional regulator [Streptococcus suis]|uniref:TetR/AcrR family transcriptional regulator n=1 Tax=Streptococcus suis TaxID=1307 RepID=UPI001C974ACC|nr:TetR/AcrR family transcriptional regulator [Streptococcus suis]MBY4956730.1 TetR/AcrR family transcriptional regulator [Streptococcus suis]MBY5017862.1 TetR/AcrR family transcriptional regulator [Streptococcus suis]MBY5033277.1 TetR/AcrR family transcriptional regulator [Streptococcus suis]MBY5037794.1 TetR/AcrR family transcriptional regulator [Streptococcus suis]HEL1661394.1 TetR/AcrR family transcriptional regulator [Streptococcus suis]